MGLGGLYEAYALGLGPHHSSSSSDAGKKRDVSCVNVVRSQLNGLCLIAPCLCCINLQLLASSAVLRSEGGGVNVV